MQAKVEGGLRGWKVFGVRKACLRPGICKHLPRVRPCIILLVNPVRKHCDGSLFTMYPSSENAFVRAALPEGNSGEQSHG